MDTETPSAPGEAMADEAQVDEGLGPAEPAPADELNAVAADEIAGGADDPADDPAAEGEPEVLAESEPDGAELDHAGDEDE